MHVFIELGIIVSIAAVISLLMKFLKQPLVVGYILSGVIIGPFFLNLIESTEYIELFSKIGIAILLFIVGLSLKPDIIREVGKISILTGLGQIVVTSTLGFLIMQLLGFGTIPSIYGAIALTFSSTIIILKLLSDKGDMNKLYGKIAIGFLLVQDIFATLILLTISIIGTVPSFSDFALVLILKGIFFFLALYLVSRYVLPRLLSYLASSQELLFLFSVAWGLGLASIFYLFGFSLEIGALAAGISLSVSPFSQEIGSRMKPLRDFFLLLFFVLLGSQLALFNLGTVIIPALILSVFVLIGNPLIVVLLMNLFGYRSRTAFLAGLTVAQISEFSLIFIALGFSLGHIDNSIVSLVTLVGIITIAGSTYLILYAEKIFKFLHPVLRAIKIRRNPKKHRSETEEKGEMIIFGYDRVGHDLVEVANKIEKKYFVVDFDPTAIRILERRGIPFKFGDANDVDFMEEIGVSNASIIISTIPDFRTNLNLVSYYRNRNPEGLVIVNSHNIRETKEFYNHGASFVVMPHYLGAKHASKMIESYSSSLEDFEKERNLHFEYLEKRGKITN
ncbi:MAG: cation:proton antiporter family protein [Patescibacteria group bacterium]|nr:cation:proton antiporter family protein [Patescibacteria group bacterium]